MILDHKTRPERVIDAKQLEDLFAKGLSLEDVAREMKMNKSFLSKKINAKYSLTLARERGKARANNLVEAV